MALWLVRHGEAMPESADPDQALTPAGLAQAASMAAALGRLGVVPARILHSGKLGARQTAEAIASALGMEAGRTQGLKPLDDVEPWAARAQGEDLMLVGHLPFLDKLASLLLCSRAHRSVIRFTPCTAVMLQREDGEWRLVWLLTPGVAKTLTDQATEPPA